MPLLALFGVVSLLSCSPAGCLRGVEDLRDGIIRTPLSPMITFQDDPLRVLRAIRFAARFGFTLHEVKLNAAIAE